jgi:hypothetical protein
VPIGATPIDQAEPPPVAMNDPAFGADVRPLPAAAREQASIGRTTPGPTSSA